MKQFASLTNRGQIGRLRRLAMAALADYEIPSPQLRSLYHGDNTTFRVEAADGQRYVIRIGRPPVKARAEIESEMAWLAALKDDTGLRVPGPVARQSGGFVTEATAPGVPEARMCVVLRWLEGKFVNRRLTPRHLYEVGQLTARLHDHATGWKLPDGFVRWRLDSLYGKSPGVSEGAARRMKSDIDALDEGLAAVAAVRSRTDLGRCIRLVDRYRETIAEIGFGRRVFGLIHGDLHQENYLFGPNGVAVIDFDDCGFGHFVYDMAVTLLEVSFRQNYPQLREAFLAGYRSVREFPGSHERHLEMFMRYRDLQLMMWAIELRDHPLWRDRWRAEAEAVMEAVTDFLQDS